MLQLSRVIIDDNNNNNNLLTVLRDTSSRMMTLKYILNYYPLCCDECESLYKNGHHKSLKLILPECDEKL